MNSQMTDIKRMDEIELNEHVQALTLEHQFDTAAELIAQWVYWDEIKKEVREIVEWEHSLDMPEDGSILDTVTPVKKTKKSVEDRLTSEFGESWHD